MANVSSNQDERRDRSRAIERHFRHACPGTPRARPLPRAGGWHADCNAGARGIIVQGVDWIGWLSSIVLLMTLGNQVRKQWRSGESQGVSRWLFVGQTAASVGFSVYSLLLENWVFVVTNLLILLNALAGQWVTARNRRAQRARRHGESALVSG
jgi:uncharacterized protein with PQ loop repeat